FLPDSSSILGAVVDEKLPDGRGRDWIKAARKREPDLPIIIISAHSSPDLVNFANESRVDMACKPTVTQALRVFARKAEARVANGARADRAIGTITAEVAIACGLTPRQHEVYDTYVRADAHEPRSRIAERLGISMHGFRRHTRRILKGTHCQSLDELKADTL